MSDGPVGRKSINAKINRSIWTWLLVVTWLIVVIYRLFRKLTERLRYTSGLVIAVVRWLCAAALQLRADRNQRKIMTLCVCLGAEARLCLVSSLWAMTTFSQMFHSSAPHACISKQEARTSWRHVFGVSSNKLGSSAVRTSASVSVSIKTSCPDDLAFDSCYLWWPGYLGFQLPDFNCCSIVQHSTVISAELS